MTPSISFLDRAKSYCARVAAGEQITSRYTRLACERFLADLERDDWRWIYDETRADKVCKFIQLCPHEKGAKQGQLLQLEDFQVWIVCNIFGFVDCTTRLRRFREAVLMIPRKNGKSPLAAAIALYMTFFDGEPGAETYCGALTEDQAFEVFRPAKAMLEGMPDLCKRFGIQLNAKSLVQRSSRSRMRPVIGAGRDGSMPHIFVGDEAHQWRDSSLYDAQSTGMVGRSQPLKLIISTAGDTIEGPCHSKQREVEQMLDGAIPNDRLFGAIYTADPDLDWTSREALISANPNLGVSVGEEYLVEAQQAAIMNSAKQGTFRCKHLNHWVTASNAWMNMEFFSRCADPELKEDDLLEYPCVLGSDLASKIDLSATVKLFRKDIDDRPHYYAFLRCYVPEARVDDPANQHYQRWMHDGFLTATEGSSLDYSVLEGDAVADITRFKVSELAYDERYADQFAQRVVEATDVVRVVIPPSPKELSPAMKELESAVYDGRFHYDGNPTSVHFSCESQGEGQAPLIAAQFGVIETDASVYEWNQATEELTVYDVRASPPMTPYVPAAPQNLVLISSAATAVVGADGVVRPRIEATWDTPEDVLTLQIQVQYQAAAAGATWITAALVDVSANLAYIEGIVAGAVYNVRIRGLRSNGAASPWTEIDGFTAGLTLSVLSQNALAPGTLIGQAFGDGTAEIICSPFTAQVGQVSVAVLPSGYTITGLAQSTFFYVYYSDPNFLGGNVTPIATQNPSDYLGQVGAFLIDSIVTPSAASSGSGSGSSGIRYSPSTGTDVGSRTTVNPTAAYDGTTAAAIVSASSSSSATTTGKIIYQGWPMTQPSAATTLSVVLTEFAAAFGGSGTCTITAILAGSSSTLASLTAPGGQTTYTLPIPAGTTLSTVSVTVSVTAAIASGRPGNSIYTASAQVQEIYIS